MTLGLLWLLDAGLQLQPYMFTKAFVANVLSMNAMYQPHTIGEFIIALTGFLAPHAAAWNALFVAIQFVIGVGLLWRRTARPALAVSFVWVLGVWSIGEGFGGLLTGTATIVGGAPGAVLLYGLIGLLLWPRTRHDQDPTGTSVAAEGILGDRGGRILWAVLWLGGAILEILPDPYPPSSVLVATINMNLPEPGALMHLDIFTVNFVEWAGIPLILILIVAEALIGLQVLRGGRWVRPVLLAGIILSVVFWVVGQNFGGILAGSATDPNAGPLYVLLALTLYPREARNKANNQQTMNATLPET
ncbi:MAG: hypothetical protein ACYCU8_05880 [Ferrimicrobium acidiphilum]